ncbi:MAG: Txe/YoeB family addiction module toxin [Saprospiraceae bacterium]|nr:Txe/YoeB family addiction module toxin [Candidatus Vicinibacter affinis]
MKDLSWDKDAWEDYLYWQLNDKNTLKRINKLIVGIQRDPFAGIGKPESLKSNLAGYYSRRIDTEHRLVYAVYEDRIHIIQCRLHY